MKTLVHSRRRRVPAILGGTIAALLLGACSADRSTSPLVATDAVASWEGNELPGYVRVCKEGGPAGTYTFNVSVVGGGSHYLNLGAQSSLVFDGTTIVCNTVYTPILDDSWEEGETANVTITEVLGADMNVSKIDIYNIVTLFPGYLGSLYNTPTVTVTTGPLDRYKIHYFNALVPPPPPPPPSSFGCTPGYWKQKQHFDSWIPTGLTPTQTVASVFSNATMYGLGGYTLLQGLGFKGGSTVAGAAGILLRAAIAGQLNALHSDVGAPLTAAAMVIAVNNALASGDRDTMLGLAQQIDVNNNLGCSLN